MKFKRPKGNILWVSMVWALLGVMLLINAPPAIDPIKGIVHTFHAWAVLMLLASLLVWLDAKWIVWPLIVFNVVGLLIRLMNVLDDEFSLRSLSRIIIPLWTIFALYEWRYLQTNEAEGDDSEEDRPMLSLVALLREPTYVDSAILATAAKKAWDADLHHGDLDDQSGDSGDEGDGFVAGQSPSCIIQYQGKMMLVNSFGQPYVEEVDSAVQGIQDLRLKKCFGEHTAWLSCDAMGVESLANRKEVNEWLGLLGRLLGELVDENCLAIYLPHTDQMFANMQETLESLTSPDLVASLEANSPVPVTVVPDDDPQMRQAVDKARKCFHRFEEAFESKSGDRFSVKAPITTGGETEYIWIEVDVIENGVIHGRLGNEPVDLADLYLGAQVRVASTEINDWNFVDALGKPQGLFTVKVLANIANDQRDRTRGDER